MEKAMATLKAEIDEITGKGRGEQKTELPLRAMTREQRQLSTRASYKYLGVDLGSSLDAWTEFTCPTCGASLRYLSYPSPYDKLLHCPECESPLGIIGIDVVKIVQTTPPQIYECPYCAATFVSDDQLIHHIAVAHPTEPSPEPAPSPTTLVDWLKARWMLLTVGGLGVVVVGTVIAKSRKAR